MRTTHARLLAPAALTVLVAVLSPGASPNEDSNIFIGCDNLAPLRCETHFFTPPYVNKQFVVLAAPGYVGTLHLQASSPTSSFHKDCTFAGTGVAVACIIVADEGDLPPGEFMDVSGNADLVPPGVGLYSVGLNFNV